MSQNAPVTPELRDRGAAAAAAAAASKKNKVLGDAIVFRNERHSKEPAGSTSSTTVGNEKKASTGATEDVPKSVHFEVVEDENDEDDKNSKPRKAIGKTPSGQVFVVPQTHDMVSNLLSPNQPKNLGDLFVLLVLAAHISLVFVIPRQYQKWTLGPIFLFWRACYNFGIGRLLLVQSRHKLLVHWARKYKIFDKEANPKLHAFLKSELSSKIDSEDYDFDTAPIEYNTWLVFRKVVDLILMCDFVTYMLFAMVCFNMPDHAWYIHTVRFIAALVLFLFNVWVKLDAHRVVKDFAWYWGDFFFLVEQELTFDGVYDVAPHPMYSVGYAGYYAISGAALSAAVLSVSVIAHAGQFLFLHYVENPHIEKVYNAPVLRVKKSGVIPPKVVTSADESPVSQVGSLSSGLSGSYEEFLINGENAADDAVPAGRPLLGIKNFDILRAHNLACLIITGYLLTLNLATPKNTLWKNLFIGNAVFWRLVYSFGLGWILNLQSERKYWTRRFLKYGESTQFGWRAWQALYFLCTYMNHISFIMATLKLIEPSELLTSYGVVRIIGGSMLILLQVWTSNSIYESVGEFGWFYGDFFFDNHPNLTYSGIYRYLNSPERLFGVMSVWGFAVIASSMKLMLVAALAHICTIYFLQCVERPHMQKLYGDTMRREAGLTRTIRKAVPPPVEKRISKLQGSLDNVLATTSNKIGEVVNTAKSKLLAWDTNTKEGSETGITLGEFPALLTITRLADDLSNYDINYYSVSILNAKTSPEPIEGATSNFKPLSIPFGTPLRVAWTAPINHSKEDWIGLYRVADNESKRITKIASMDRWIAVSKGGYAPHHEKPLIVTDKIMDDDRFEDEYIIGEADFAGDRLFWRRGVYEFRYHHGGKHNVMASSLPFEVTFEKFSDERFESGQSEVEDELLPLVQACFEMKEGIAPDELDDEFGALGNGKYSKRIVYAINEIFGLDLAPEVVVADKTVRKLAWRIRRAKKVLAPFSMSVPAMSAPTTPKMEDAH